MRPARTEREIRYWVEHDDGSEMGDYGGYQFDTRGDAEDFVTTTLEDDTRDQGEWESGEERAGYVILKMIVVRRWTRAADGVSA